MAARSSSRVRRGPRVHDDEESSDASAYDSESGEDDTGKAGGASAQKWVQCDKCGQWRRLSGITDLKSLPKRWFCKLNPDLRYNDCKIPVGSDIMCSPRPHTNPAAYPSLNVLTPTPRWPQMPRQEEQEDDEQRLRSHLRLWVRRMKGADDAETRLPMAHGTRAAKRQRPVGEQEWVQCCDPNCGKWRALHRSMDSSSLQLKEWYCVMNSWDEALASCAAPQVGFAPPPVVFGHISSPCVLRPPPNAIACVSSAGNSRRARGDGTDRG